MCDIHDWADIKDRFTDGLLLGNGSSIAFSHRFRYEALLDEAISLDLITDNLGLIFDHFETSDFEKILKMLWHTQNINEALGVEDCQSSAAYSEIRNALIGAVSKVHPDYEEVEENLLTASNFMAHFQTVLSLNYDLIAYWAITAHNDSVFPNRIKDCFNSGSLHENWRALREPYGRNDRATLVAYPHGNLCLETSMGGERKILRRNDSLNTDGSLLAGIVRNWREGDSIPLFVSEGLSEQKIEAIARSHYLSTVYHEIIPDIRDSLVVYGCSLSNNDLHLLDKFRCSRFAIGVNPDSEATRDEMVRFRQVLIRSVHQNVEVIFFNRNSAGCWINR
jgi:hypothetical protein